MSAYILIFISVLACFKVCFSYFKSSLQAWSRDYLTIFTLFQCNDQFLASVCEHTVAPQSFRHIWLSSLVLLLFRNKGICPAFMRAMSVSSRRRKCSVFSASGSLVRYTSFVSGELLENLLYCVKLHHLSRSSALPVDIQSGSFHMINMHLN